MSCECHQKIGEPCKHGMPPANCVKCAMDAKEAAKDAEIARLRAELESFRKIPARHVVLSGRTVYLDECDHDPEVTYTVRQSPGEETRSYVWVCKKCAKRVAPEIFTEHPCGHICSRTRAGGKEVWTGKSLDAKEDGK